jgi:microcompartment protein CcmK/EutM
MFLGKAVGRMVCSMVYEGMEDVPLLWVQPLDKLDADGEPNGGYVIAIDTVGIVDEVG